MEIRGMRQVLRMSGLMALIAYVGVAVGAAEDKKPKYTIKEVMAKAMKGGLCKKCASGKASDDEKKELVELFTALSENSPPKGEKESWKKKTKALVDAAKSLADGGTGAGKKLGGAANCKACHSSHKGD
jgi:surface antigen